MFKKTNAESNFKKDTELLLMIMTILSQLPQPKFPTPSTIINIYSDKKVEIKDVEQFFKDDESTNAK